MSLRFAIFLGCLGLVGISAVYGQTTKPSLAAAASANATGSASGNSSQSNSSSSDGSDQSNSTDSSSNNNANNVTRIPLSLAKLPAAAPVRQQPVNYRVHWKDSLDNGSPIQEYRVEYWQRDSNRSDAKTVNATSDFVDLENLLPGEIYNAEVSAKNEQGYSSALALTFKTQFVVNSTDISQTCMTEIVDRTATTLLLDFFMHDEVLDVESFEVRYSLADQSFDYAATRLLPRDSNYVITGLLPGTRYRFRITTRTRLGQGGPCGEFDTIMPDVGPPLAPKAGLSNTVSFRLQWENLINNETVKHYRLQYWKDAPYGMARRFQEFVKAPQNAFNLTNLEPCQKYQVEIAPRQSFQPRNRPDKSGPGPSAPFQYGMMNSVPRTAHIMKLYFTTECTIVTGSVESPGFTL